MLFLDIALAIATAAILAGVLMRFAHEHGPWQKPWAFPFVVFLFAWAGGAWMTRDAPASWLLHALPFVGTGLVAALLIVSVSPPRDTTKTEERIELEHEEQAVLYSVVVFFYSLVAMLLLSVALAYVV